MAASGLNSLMVGDMILIAIKSFSWVFPSHPLLLVLRSFMAEKAVKHLTEVGGRASTTSIRLKIFSRLWSDRSLMRWCHCKDSFISEYMFNTILLYLKQEWYNYSNGMGLLFFTWNISSNPHYILKMIFVLC